MPKTSKKIIVIDDEPSNNFICCRIIKKLCEPVPTDIRTFTKAEEGLHYLKQLIAEAATPVVLFLDISMPAQINGWDVLDRLHTLPNINRENISVYMLSSSTYSADREKALNYPLVANYIVKPLNDSMTWLKEDLFFIQERTVQTTLY